VQLGLVRSRVQGRDDLRFSVPGWGLQPDVRAGSELHVRVQRRPLQLQLPRRQQLRHDLPGRLLQPDVWHRLDVLDDLPGRDVRSGVRRRPELHARLRGRQLQPGLQADPHVRDHDLQLELRPGLPRRHHVHRGVRLQGDLRVAALRDRRAIPVRAIPVQRISARRDDRRVRIHVDGLPEPLRRDALCKASRPLRIHAAIVPRGKLVDPLASEGACLGRRSARRSDGTGRSPSPARGSGGVRSSENGRVSRAR